MRCVGAIFFTLFAMMSLLIVVGLVAAWAGWSRGFLHEGPGRFGVYADRGMLEIASYERIPRVGDRFGVTQTWSAAGISVHRTPGVSPPNHRVEVEVPLAYVVPVFAVVPAAWVGWWRRRRRRQRWITEGRCLDCGYDLRESAERCPECGADIAAPGHDREACR